jgi:hypothetical protein
VAIVSYVSVLYKKSFNSLSVPVLLNSDSEPRYLKSFMVSLFVGRSFFPGCILNSSFESFDTLESELR